MILLIDNLDQFQLSIWMRSVVQLSFAAAKRVRRSKLVVMIISVERKVSGFFGNLLAVSILFRLKLPFERLDFFEEKSQRLLSKISFGFKEVRSHVGECNLSHTFDNIGKHLELLLSCWCASPIIYGSTWLRMNS
jgi:hypothetical protein